MLLVSFKISQADLKEGHPESDYFSDIDANSECS